MNSIKKQCHLKAMAETLEISLMGGLLASSFDTLWILMDMKSNGIQVHYVVILVALILSTILMSVALIRHHRINVRNQLGAVYALKKQVIRCKNRRKGK